MLHIKPNASLPPAEHGVVSPPSKPIGRDTGKSQDVQFLTVLVQGVAEIVETPPQGVHVVSATDSK